MNKRNAGMRLAWLLLATLLVLMAVGCHKTQAPAVGVEKAITVHVVFPDQSEKEYTVTTDAEMLGQALLDEGLIEGEMQEYGLFIETVAGVTADASAGEYWLFTKGGEWVTTGADLTPIVDGDGFEFFIYK